MNREVNILGYSGNYVYVEDIKTKEKGYIHNLLVNDKPLNIVKEYLHIYEGALKEGVIVIKYDKGEDVEWSLSKTGIVEIEEYNSNNKILSVKGISAGTVTLTVKSGSDKDTCSICCIDKWGTPETAKAETAIKVMNIPGGEAVSSKTISVGATVMALGNISNKYLYVSSGNIWGFIKTEDFPGIKYVMSQYHYYDQGYDERFKNVAQKISEYADVLNDVMMANFKLRVFYSISPYTSVADNCKIMSYGLVDLNNLGNSCPQTSGHYSDSCLLSDNVRDDLRNQFGRGGGSISKVVWIGHIMKDNARSNAIVGNGDIIMTPYGTIGQTETEIREDRVYTLVHETSHQFGIYDHYCKEDYQGPLLRCTNTHCIDCYGNGESKDCIMYKRENIEEEMFTELYCDACKENILNYIKDF